MLTLVIAEAALEAIPESLWSHPIVIRDASRQGKEPRQILLDRSYHHRAMRRLRDAWKRERPDIANLCLLEALGSALNRERRLTTIVHSIADLILEFDPSIRLPRNCLRFKGLMEQAIQLRRVPPTGRPLITVTERTMQELLEDVEPTFTLALTTLGKVRTYEELAEALKEGFESALDVELETGELSPSEKMLAERLRKEKYAPPGLDVQEAQDLGLRFRHGLVSDPSSRRTDSSKRDVSR